jgi:hypothetical protein
MVEKTGGNLMASHELGRCADPAQQFFHNLTFEFDGESSSVLHGKILSPVSRDDRSCPLL